MKYKFAFFAILTIAHFSAHAVESAPAINCKTSLGEFQVAGSAVLLNGEKYKFDKEIVQEADAVSVSGFLGGAGTDCRAVTHLASRSANGDIVILEMGRSKVAKLGGILCSISTDPNKFENPFRWRQTVISKNSDGKYTARTIDVLDTIGRPDLKPEDLKNPRLFEDNAAIHKFVNEQLMDRRYHKVSMAVESCDGSADAKTENGGASDHGVAH
jgi:hypothetical protein